jgi:hypothetical protein
MLAVRDDDGEVLEVLHGIDYSTDTAYVKRYRRSFTARLIQSWDSSKYYYSILKNEALSYSGVKSVISWDYDCVSANLMPAVKFDIRGKTLCLYFPLNPDDYKEARYGVEHTTLKKYEDEPCLLRIKDETCIEYAKKLISDIMTKYGAKQGKVMRRNYDKPYEPIQPLVEKGLAKEYLAKEKYSDFLKRSDKAQQLANKTSGLQEAEKEETKPLIDLDEEDIEEVHLIDKSSGKEIIKRYNKSFTAKLIQSSDETKSFYATLKNEILSYESTKSTIWWNCDSIHTSNRTIARFGIQDGILCLYLALKPQDYVKTYPVETAVGKRYAHVPCMFRIKNSKRRKDAVSLIAILAEKCDIKRGATQNEEYYCAYESTETLISKGLIKEVGSREGVEEKKCESRKALKKNAQNRISARNADKLLTDEQAMSLVQDGRSGKKRIGKKAEVNIDTIAASFEVGDVVNIEKLQQKGIVPTDAAYVKILAHGELDKKLTVEAQDFEICAVKMILLTGGTARKI